MAYFDHPIYDSKSEEILKVFDIEPNFLKNEYFLSVKNDFLSQSQKQHLFKQFQNRNAFIPTLKEMFLKEGIPQEFLYLAMVESEFSPFAKSKKKAVGIWQFIPSTAKSLGLKINSQIDERRDPIKSTQAAITYLKRLKEDFGKWYLAALAYNAGDARLKKAIKEAQSNSLSVLLDPDAKYLPLESRMYIRKILLVSFLFSDVNILKSGDYDYFLNRGANALLASIKVKPSTPLARIASQAGISLKELRFYNPQFKQNYTPNISQAVLVHLPYEALLRYSQKKIQNPKNEKYIVHRVKRGDTLSLIAKYYGIPSKKIAKFNTISNANALSINQEILIPLES